MILPPHLFDQQALHSQHSAETLPRVNMTRHGVFSVTLRAKTARLTRSEGHSLPLIGLLILTRWGLTHFLQIYVFCF